ncbi:MAG: zinc ribbon domain-containing protein [Streptosporangiaceae bacterium]
MGQGPEQAPWGDAFAGILFCGVCQRRMQGHWINAAPSYRCRFPAEYALASKITHPRNVYLRQDASDTEVNGWLAAVFDPGRLDDTIDRIHAAQQGDGDRSAAEVATAAIADAAAKMARYRAALDAGGDPGEIGSWIADVHARKISAESDLRRATAKAGMTRQQITDLISGCADIATELRHARPEDLAGIHRSLGLRLTCHPERQIVRAAARPEPANIGKWLVSEERVVAYVHARDHW